MRSYPTNSPEAAARIVGLLLISDGHVSRSETDALQRLDIERELGLAPGDFAQVLHALCEDLLMGARERRLLTGNLDEAALAALMAEVTEPELQQRVLHFACAAATADHHVAAAEAWIMEAALKHWRMGEASDPPEAAPVAAGL
ncbi:TerB family tellurite resistance protein [Acidovorax sp. SUPP2522]|uniref:TerB family tellurite resistance protein n=1 Tax=unclassified Acidovorax TaxID=2684926 RepID=UPI00234AB784|nr:MULTISPECIES: TerB family tellurite resistance protein [unclassified Acidovorax]WCM96326.1 TerB family tellurite resistance protein [Acidovorax sp. GBBC 1281]GKT16894.1 TerB family tellurite resistance protein [Acidovorax sp. SUPP2522]